MTRIGRMLAPACLTLIALSGCNDSESLGLAWALGNPQPIELEVRTFLPTPGEDPASSATVSGGSGAVEVDGSRPATCGVLAEGLMRRDGAEIEIMVQVDRNPISSCAEVPIVLSYHAAITGLAPGNYRVRVYETFMGGALRRVAATTVTVTAP